MIFNILSYSPWLICIQDVCFAFLPGGFPFLFFKPLKKMYNTCLVDDEFNSKKEENKA